MARLAVEAHAVGRPSPPGAVYEMIAAETTVATDPNRPTRSAATMTAPAARTGCRGSSDGGRANNRHYRCGKPALSQSG